MPATILDPHTALVLIDMQRGIVELPHVDPVEHVVGNVARLAAAFRAAQQPVVLVRVAFSADGADRLRPRAQPQPQPTGTPREDFAELIAELDQQPSDVVITKRQWGAFYGTELDLQLRRRGVTGIVLAGISTSVGVESTARAAFEHGYNLTFASDAMTDSNREAQERALVTIFPRMGEVDTTESILRLL